MSAHASAPVIDWEALRAQAEAVRGRAYAPYSGYRVGAALLAADGRVFVGANVENASYGLCLCAERSATAAAVAAGVSQFIAIAITSPGDSPATPCGMCRQVLAELAPGIPVHCYGAEGGVIETDVGALLPGAFDRAVLDAGRAKDAPT